MMAAKVGTFGKRGKKNDEDDEETLMTSRRAMLAGKALFTVGGEDVDDTLLHAHVHAHPTRTGRIIPSCPPEKKNFFAPYEKKEKMLNKTNLYK